MQTLSPRRSVAPAVAPSKWLYSFLQANTCTGKLNHLKVCSQLWGDRYEIAPNTARTASGIGQSRERTAERGPARLTGWSASSSVPYMRTLREHLSNSEIFRGNHNTSSSSVGNSAGSTILARRSCLSLCDIRQTAKAHNKQEKRKSPLPSSSVQMLSGGSRVTMVV